MTTTTNLPFIGGELSSFDPFDANCIESTTAGSYDPAFARCSLSVAGNLSGAYSPAWAAQSSFWFHGTSYVNFSVSGVFMLNFFTTGLVEVLRVVSHATASLQYDFYTLQSGVMTFVGAVPATYGTRNQFDIHITDSISGTLSVYVSGTLIFSATGLNHSGWTGVAQIAPRGAGTSTSYLNYWSEIICDSSSHVGDRVITYPVNTNSAVNTGWTGSVTNVNEVVLADFTFVYAASASLTSTYYASGFSLGTYNVVAVAVTARALVNSGSGPQNLQIVLRTGGSNFNSSSIGLNAGYQACSHSWTTNPHTSATWLASDAQAVEGGQESIT